MAEIDLNPIQLAVLHQISAGEAVGYNTLYGGHTFSSYLDHPRIGFRTPQGDITHAAGRYQFQPDTWDAEVKRLGLPDFSPKSQDLAAWDLANRTYYQNTRGRSLEADEATNSVRWEALANQWPSLRRLGPQQDRMQLAGGESATPSDPLQDIRLPASFAQYGVAPNLLAPGGGSPPSPSADPLSILGSLQAIIPGHRLVPVHHDPFQGPPRLVPVDHDPFADDTQPGATTQ